MKEYNFEEGIDVNISDLKSERIPQKQYTIVHKKISILCHDIFIEIEGGILLVVRRRYPAKGILWPVGGRIKRGVRIKDSLKDKVREECDLELSDIKELGCARTFFKTDPLGHGKGTDTLNIVYFARGKGKLKLDNFHKNPVIVKPQNYKKGFRKELHPYVRDFMDIAIKLLKKS